MRPGRQSGYSKLPWRRRRERQLDEFYESVEAGGELERANARRREAETWADPRLENLRQRTESLMDDPSQEAPQRGLSFEPDTSRRYPVADA